MQERFWTEPRRGRLGEIASGQIGADEGWIGPATERRRGHRLVRIDRGEPWPRKTRRFEVGVVTQDGAFELLESDTGIQPELIAQPAPGLLEHAEGVGLTSSPIQRQHQLADEPFTQGMSLDQGLQRGNDRIVAAKGENRVDTRLDH